MRHFGPGDRVVAGIAGRCFRHCAETGPVVVAAGEQRRAGRRAKRRIVHLGVAEARVARACPASASARRRRTRCLEPKPASSIRTRSTFGAPSGGMIVGGHPGWLSTRFGWMKPLKGGVGVGSTSSWGIGWRSATAPGPGRGGRPAPSAPSSAPWPTTGTVDGGSLSFPSPRFRCPFLPIEPRRAKRRPSIDSGFDAAVTHSQNGNAKLSAPCPKCRALSLRHRDASARSRDAIREGAP